MGGNQKETAVGCMFWKSLSPGHPLNRGLLISGIGVLLGDLWYLEGAVSVQMRKFIKSRYVYLYTEFLCAL